MTGANGFLGQALCKHLSKTVEVTAAVRNSCTTVPADIKKTVVGDLADEPDWHSALGGVDVVIHCAARVHVMREQHTDPAEQYRKVNVVATEQLAMQASQSGVKRLVFISSIKVNGEETPIDRPFQASDPANPVDEYGISKLHAEQALLRVSQETGLEIVIIRPPLIYGPGVKGNFQTMMRWLSRSIPLPLGGIENLRSLVALDNLVDLVATSAFHPMAAGQTFLASDGEDISTPELLRRAATAMNRNAILLPVPQNLLETLASFSGRGAMMQRLTGSLRVDNRHAVDRLGWTPPLSVAEGLRKVIADS